MNTLLITIHLIACISLVGLVLLQPGQEGMGVVFGGSSSSFFGSSGAGGLLVKLTVFMAVIFFATSLGFTYKQAQQKSGSEEQSSVVLEKKQESQERGKKPDRARISRPPAVLDPCLTPCQSGRKVLTEQVEQGFIPFHAEVVELVDTLS